MGHEIVYCSKCQTQLRSADFEKSRACRIDGVAYCTNCVPDVPKAPSVENLIPQPPPTSGSSSRSNTERIPRIPAPASHRPSGPVGYAALFVGTLLVIGLVAISVSRGKPATRDTRPGTSPLVGEPFEQPPESLLPTRVQPPVAVPVGKIEAARESFRKAREFTQARPADWAGQLALYDQAAWEARDTDLLETVRGEREGVRKRQRDAFAAEAKLFEDKLRPMIEREEFGAAIAAWREARGAHALPDWTELTDKRVAQLRAEAEVLLDSLKGKRISSKELRERIARWGLPDLEKSFADAPPAAEPPKLVASPESEAVQKSWRAAMEMAVGRDYAAAVKELERVRQETAAPALKAEAAADVELLRSLASFHAECLQWLAKWPREKVLKAEIFDEDGRLRRIQGVLLKADAGGLELRAENQTFVVPIGELASGTFDELSRARPARKPPEDERMIRFLRLVEGVAGISEELRANPDPSLHPKYLGWAEKTVAASASRESSERERQARRIYYAAEREASFPATQAVSGLKARTLLEDFKDTAFVQRNRAALTARTELGKDLVLFAEDLEGGGTFRRISGKTGASWTSESDSDPARQKENFVEAEFSVLPGTAYRSWAYVGGCCAETLGFAAQGTDLSTDAAVPAEPGSDTWLAVKQSVAVTKTHAGHGGRKQPSRWGWVELPAPAFRAPRTKSLRLLTSQQGFSVATVVVSAVRKAPPTEAELRELRKSRAARTDEAGGVALRGLALWLKADEGVMLADGLVSEWKDQSGHQRNAVQAEAGSRPLLVPGAVNGKPAVVFDGKRQALDAELGVNGLGGMTMVLVSACDQDHGSDWTEAAALLWHQLSGWGETALCPRQSRIVFMFGTGQPNCTVVYKRPASIGAAFSVSLSVKDDARELLYVNGALVLSQDSKLPRLAGSVSRATLGGGTGKTFFAGRIAEVLVYERPLVDVERKRLQHYLRMKYNAY